jgi:hypothetical protein
MKRLAAFVARLSRHELLPIILFCVIGLLLSLVAALTYSLELADFFF